MSTGFHPHTHLLALASEVTTKLFRSLTVFQSLLSTISRFSIHKRNFLEARVVIASYNDHCPALQKLRWESFDDLESEICGFALEIVNLQFAVLALVEGFTSIDEWHPVAQHPIEQSSQLGGHGLNGNGRPELTSQSAKLRAEIAMAET